MKFSLLIELNLKRVCTLCSLSKEVRRRTHEAIALRYTPFIRVCLKCQSASFLKFRRFP